MRSASSWCLSSQVYKNRLAALPSGKADLTYTTVLTCMDAFDRSGEPT